MFESMWIFLTERLFDNIAASAIWAIAASLAIKVYKTISVAIRNGYFSSIRFYSGYYFAYRWSDQGDQRFLLVTPKVRIFRRFGLGRFYLSWTTPDGDESVFPLIEHTGREIYAYGRSSDFGSRSFFVIHPAHTKPVYFVSGLYVFVNASHEVVSGSFLLSKFELTHDEVFGMLEKNQIISSQLTAYSRYKKFRLLDLRSRSNFNSSYSNMIKIRAFFSNLFNRCR